jgi:hypothetical protein
MGGRAYIKTWSILVRGIKANGTSRWGIKQGLPVQKYPMRLASTSGKKEEVA